MLRLLTLALLGALFSAASASADSWPLPERTTYVSSDRATRFTVNPRDLPDQFAQFSDKVEAKEPAGQRRSGATQASGKLERRVGASWSTIWEGPLVNEVAPVEALVANGGAYIVTFDNWYSTGFGDNVVVIYRANGSVVRSMRLTDILPESYVQALPASVSSLRWNGDHSLSSDGKQVILKVVIPTEKAWRDKAEEYVDVPIDLATGQVRLEGRSWKRAMAIAAPLIARTKAADAASRAKLIAPLVSPIGTQDDEWSRYLYQAAARLAPERYDGFPSDWILPASTSPDFTRRSKRIREALSNSGEKVDFSFAAPAAPAELVRLLSDTLGASAPGRLRGSRIFVGLPANRHAEIFTALKRTGAEVILFDPNRPIPQRTDKLRDLGVAENQVEVEAKRAEETARQFDAEANRLDALARSTFPQEEAASIGVFVSVIVALIAVGAASASNLRLNGQS